MATVWLIVRVFLKRYWQDVLIVFLLYLLVRRNMQYRKILKWMALLSAKLDALKEQRKGNE